jgi:hypothetical protein
MSELGTLVIPSLAVYYRGSITMPQSDIFVSIQTLCRNHFRPPDCILGTKDYTKLHHKRPNWEPLLFRLWLFIIEDRSQCPRVIYLYQYKLSVGIISDLQTVY